MPTVLDQRTLALIEEIAERVRQDIERGVLPALEFPVRSLGNVQYDTQKGYFELGEACKSRTLTANTVRAFAQTLRLMAASRQMVHIWDKSPDASLTPTMLSTDASRSSVAGSTLHPVRPGTLYTMIGRSTASAMVR